MSCAPRPDRACSRAHVAMIEGMLDRSLPRTAPDMRIDQCGDRDDGVPTIDARELIRQLGGLGAS